jgi:hypothetical protein
MVENRRWAHLVFAAQPALMDLTYLAPEQCQVRSIHVCDVLFYSEPRNTNGR